MDRRHALCTVSISNQNSVYPTSETRFSVELEKPNRSTKVLSGGETKLLNLVIEHTRRELWSAQAWCDIRDNIYTSK